MAKLAIQNNAINKANEWLVNAIKNNKSNLQQKQKAFELLGDINYKNDNFGIAQIAYDSLNAVLKTNPQFEQIVLRKKWIPNVYQQTSNYQKEDTLQYIYQLPKEIQAPAAKAWAKRNAIEIQKLTNLFTDKFIKDNLSNDPSTAITSINVSSFTNNNNASSFYFDNSTTISQGKQSFVQKWGERPNVDQWRRKSSGTIANALAKTVNNNLVSFTKDSLDSKKNYTFNKLASKDSINYQLITDSISLNSSRKNWNIAALTTAQTFLLKLNDFEKAKPIYQKIIEKNIEPSITERAFLDLASQYLHDGDIEKSNSIINIVIKRFPNGIYASKKLEEETKKNKDQNIVNQYKEAYFLSQIGNWSSLEKLATSMNADIRKTKWNIPFQFLKVKMYAQQKLDSNAILVLDSIIVTSKSDIIKEKARNIINEIKNRKGTEDYLASLQITREQYVPETILDTPIKKTSANNLIVQSNPQSTIHTTAQAVKKDSTTQTVTQVITPRIVFDFDSTQPHFVAFVTKNVKPMFVKEMQTAFTNVNEEDFAKLKLNTTFVQFEEGTYIVWIGPFENTQKSIQYLNRIKPKLKTELISFIPEKQYEMYILGKSNILLIKTQEDLKLYKEFMLNKIYKP